MVSAVVFDIGGVLERVGEPDWLERWRIRLGMEPRQFEAALGRVDRDDLIQVGAISEGEFRRWYAAELELTDGQAEQFLADLWDWYCGEPDRELIDYAVALRPRYRTGILSNSADGARREETKRYGFPELVDVVVYSHEVGLAKPDPRVYALTCKRLDVPPSEVVFVDDTPACVDAATSSGLLGVLHTSTAETIATLDTLLRP